MARGAFPDSHPLHLGMPGMHGNGTPRSRAAEGRPADHARRRFDDRVTGKLSTFAPDAKVIHVDIDPAEISARTAVADVPIVGDCAR
jgi:acetolactate synthase-1/2/3 large subunit